MRVTDPRRSMEAVCRRVRQELSACLEGEASPELMTHLEHCSYCQSVVEDLRAIEQAAPQIAETHEPRPLLWKRIENAAYTEGLVQEKPFSGWFHDLVREWWPLPAPVLAGAYVVVLVIAAVVISFRVATPPPPLRSAPAPPDIAAELTSVEHSMLAQMEKSDPGATEVYRTNLATANYYIDLCQRTLDQDPRNSEVRHSLEQAYTEKADLLHSMLDPDEMGSMGSR